jgi:hypothetical protein
MRANPRAAGRHVAQHRVEHAPGLPFMDRIDPDEHPIDRQKLGAHLVGDVIGVNRWLRAEAKCFQRFEDPMITIVLSGCASPRLPITAPNNRDPVALHTVNLVRLVKAGALTPLGL